MLLNAICNHFFFKSYRIPYNFFFLRMYSFLWKKIFNTFSLWWYCSDLFKIWIFLYSGTRWRYNNGFKRPSEDYYNNIWYNIILIFLRPFANSIFIQVNILNLDFAKRVYLYLMGPICEMCDVFGKYDFFGGGGDKFLYLSPHHALWCNMRVHCVTATVSACCSME